MTTAKNIYEQQVQDFLCRARGKLGELTAERINYDPSCRCEEDDLVADLHLAIRTLSDCRSGLSYKEQLRIVDIMASRADLTCAAHMDTENAVIVQEGSACGCAGGGTSLVLPLTGEQVTVRVGGFTRQLQSVIMELYTRASNIYLIDGGLPSSIYHPSIN